jgi:hypothetical protein
MDSGSSELIFDINLSKQTIIRKTSSKYPKFFMKPLIVLGVLKVSDYFIQYDIIVFNLIKSDPING